MTIPKKETFLNDYTPPAHLVDSIALRVELDPQSTRVHARLQCRPNTPGRQPLALNGKRLQLVRVTLDGTVLAPKQYHFTDGMLVIPQVPEEPFLVEIDTIINPACNTALEGLYLSSGNYCSQCEAEGFRTITCFPDRPDVMTVFTTTVIGDKDACPVLLSNGNLIDSGDLPDLRCIYPASLDGPAKKWLDATVIVRGKVESYQGVARLLQIHAVEESPSPHDPSS